MIGDINDILSWLNPQTVLDWISSIALILLFLFLFLIVTTNVSQIRENIIILKEIGKKKVIITVIVSVVILLGGFIVDKYTPQSSKEEKKVQDVKETAIFIEAESPKKEKKVQDVKKAVATINVEQLKSDTISIKEGETKTAFDGDVRINIETIQEATQLRVIGYINGITINIENKTTKEIENYKIRVLELDTVCATFEIIKK